MNNKKPHKCHFSNFSNSKHANLKTMTQFCLIPTVGNPIKQQKCRYCIIFSLVISFSAVVFSQYLNFKWLTSAPSIFYAFDVFQLVWSEFSKRERNSSRIRTGILKEKLSWIQLLWYNCLHKKKRSNFENLQSPQIGNALQ